MTVTYVVFGVIALVVVIIGISMIPDFIRYMKIRSM